MPKIIDYRVLHEYNQDILAGMVREAIGDCWQPFGGIAIKGNIFYQAIVRYAP